MLNDPENPDEQPFRFVEPILAALSKVDNLP
jgi:hypothetical protein